MEFLKLFLAISLVISVPSTTAFAHGPNLHKACKAECPGAKGHKGLQTCIEGKLASADAETFKGSECYKAYEAHQAKKTEHEAHPADEHHDDAPPADTK